MSGPGHGTLRPPVNDTDHVLGPANAPVTLVEYGDFECPHCFRAHPIVHGLVKKMGKRLRFVFRNFPLTQVHPHALTAAIAAESVGAHSGAEAYWRMHDAIYEHQQHSEDALDDDHLVAYAADCGADPDLVGGDLAEGAFEDVVREQFMSGVKSGVNGTPTFFINGRRHQGAYDIATLSAEVRAALGPRSTGQSSNRR
jgi:protein-disulfide isomerase